MTLVPHDAKAGLWISKAWRPGTPGTFALVIGVSDYAKLDTSPESLTLGKLPVSALSAFRFFEWLEKDYLITNCPLAMCWLLLAPSKEELQLAPRMSQVLLSPDFEPCNNAIHDWFDEMKKLPAAAAAGSRSIFFFSGHGLEEIEDRQFLLPRDYEPPRNVERAMTTENLARGLKRLKVPLHFMFFDACRSDYDKRSEYAPLAGTRVLNEPTKDTINKNSKVSTFYASAAGTTAWSPDLTIGSMSVFSQALIEGLRAHGLQPDCNPEKCFIYLSLLEPFMEKRMQEILRSRYRSSESQEPRIRGDHVRKEVTELSSPQPQDWLPPSAPEPTLDLGSPRLPISSDAIGITLQGLTPGRISDDEMNSYLDGAGLYSFSSKAWLPDGSVEVTNLQRHQDTNVFEFDLRVLKAPKGQMYWFEVANRIQTIGCALPVDSIEPTVFHARAHAVRQPASVTGAPIGLISLRVTLFENSSGHLREAMLLWQRLDKGILGLQDLQTSLLQTPFSELRAGIENTKISWLGAMITASILTRTAQWNLADKWVKSLTSLNSSTTDGTVLWTERCLQKEEGSAVEPLRYFMLLDSSPLPILSYTIGLALRQAEYFRSIDSLPDAFRAAISRIHRRLAGAVGTFRPGGLFGCFMGRVGQVSPETIAAPAVHDEFRFALSRSVLMSRTKRANWRPYPEREIAGQVVAEPEDTFRALEKALQKDVETAQAGQAEMTAES